MQLAKAIVTNYIRLPRTDGQETETSDDKVYATELLDSCGMAITILLEKVMVKEFLITRKLF